MENEIKISEDVQKRLANIDWKSLEEVYGIRQDSIMRNPAIASQLAYNQMTDLVPGANDIISGMFSLRAFPGGEGEPWKVKIYTIEPAKGKDDTIFLYNQPIYSDAVKEALFERTDWIGNDGSRKKGFANANGGRPVTITVDGRKQDFLVSIHQPTHRVVGMPVEQVKSYFINNEGESRGRGMYGVKFSDDQIKSLAEGKAVRLDGCKNSQGEAFSCYVQFDCAARQVTTCHPGWLKEAQKTGTDLGLNRKEEQKKVQQPKEETRKSQGPKLK